MRAIGAGRGPVAPPCVILSGGETTVTVRGRGQGGRNQELAVAAAVALEGFPVPAELDLDDPADADRLRFLFRHGRVVSQVSVGSRMHLEGDIPRRLAGHAQRPASGKASA